MSVSITFLLAGDAIFTVECPDGTHHTYRVQHVEANGRWPEAWFVKLMTGSENESDRSYTYLGKLDDFTGQLKTTAKSCRPADHITVRLLNRVLARVWAGDHAAYEQHGYATHHEGRCGKCGRRLTVPESVEEGIGPECRKAMGMPALKRAKAKKQAAGDVFEASELPDFDPTAYTPTRDDEGEVVYWTGMLNGRMVTVLND